MNESQDTEITLSTGKMLAVFFGLVALCSVFFAAGYKLGRASAPALTGGEAPAGITASGGSRPSAVRTTSPPAADAALAKAPDAAPTQVPSDNSSKDTNPAPASGGAPDPMSMPATNAYYVQVAAVSKQEDADALVDALKKKDYAAMTATSADKLFHVQVGPFIDIRDAEATRAKLVADGYNPILKR
jgi:cell division septation protein DedD